MRSGRQGFDAPKVAAPPKKREVKIKYRNLENQDEVWDWFSLQEMLD